MPIEFFSLQTIYNDKEALSSSSNLIDKLGAPNVYQAIKSFLDDIFSVKALINGLEKFGSDSEFVIKGLARFILILSLKFKEDHIAWFGK